MTECAQPPKIRTAGLGGPGAAGAAVPNTSRAMW